MKGLFTFLLLIGVSLNAWADAPTPLVDQLSVNGAEATDLAKSLPGDYIDGKEGFFISTKTKKFKSTADLTEIVCTQVYMRNTLKSETCTIQKSTNGVPFSPQ